MKSLSRVQLFTTPWTTAYQAPPSMGFSRQEYWSGVPLPSLRSIYIAANSNISFLWLSSIALCVYVCICVHIYIYTHHIFIIHSSVNGHLGCFHVLTVVTSAAMNIGCMYLFELELLSFQIIGPGPFEILIRTFVECCLPWKRACHHDEAGSFGCREFLDKDWAVSCQVRLSSERGSEYWASVYMHL